MYFENLELSFHKSWWRLMRRKIFGVRLNAPVPILAPSCSSSSNVLVKRSFNSPFCMVRMDSYFWNHSLENSRFEVHSSNQVSSVIFKITGLRMGSKLIHFNLVYEFGFDYISTAWVFTYMWNDTNLFNGEVRQASIE